MQNCYLFCLCLSFRLKVKKRYLFWKKKSGIFIFRVNDILTSILSALHPFLASPNDVLKRRKRHFFFRFQAMSWKAQKGTFLAVGSGVLKSAKNLGSWKWCSQKRKKGTFYIKSLKKCKIVFSSHGKPFRILLIDRCQPFGAILWIFLSEFTNPLVKS